MCQSLPLRAVEPVYEAASYFSTGENPSGGVWSWRGRLDGKSTARPARNGNYQILPERVQVEFPPASGVDAAGWGPDGLPLDRDGLLLPAIWSYEGAAFLDETGPQGVHFKARPGVLLAHPGAARLAAVTWEAPRDGTVALAAQFQDAAAGPPGSGDDGVFWFVQLETAAPLASGALGAGGVSPLTLKSGIRVRKGDLLHFGVEPRANYVTDTTAILARVTYGPQAGPPPGQALDDEPAGSGLAMLRTVPAGGQTMPYGPGAGETVVFMEGTEVTDYPVTSGGVTTNFAGSGTLAHDQTLPYAFPVRTVTLKAGTVVSFRYFGTVPGNIRGYVRIGYAADGVPAQPLAYGFAAGSTLTVQPGSRMEFMHVPYPTNPAIADGYLLEGVAAADQSVIYSYLPGGSMTVKGGSLCEFLHAPTSGPAQAGYLRRGTPAANITLPYSATAGIVAPVKAGTQVSFIFFTAAGSARGGVLESACLSANASLFYGLNTSVNVAADTFVRFSHVIQTFTTSSNTLAYGYVRECLPAVNGTVLYGSQPGASVTIQAGALATFARGGATHSGFLEYGTLPLPGPITLPYTLNAPIRTASFKGGQPIRFALGSATDFRGYVNSGILSGSQTIYTSASTTVATTDWMTLNVSTPGTAHVASTPTIVDIDGDGFSIAEETQMGTSDLIPNNPHAEGNPAALPDDVQKRTLIVTGTLGVGVETFETKKVIIPPNSGTWLLVRAIKSAEFPRWTRDASVFNDTVTSEAKLGPLFASVISNPFQPATTLNVNALHSNWISASNPITNFLGYSPVNLEVIGSVTSLPSLAIDVDLTLKVKNVADGLLPTTAILSFLPLELKVTDFATKSDTKPYTATASATAPKNSELCLKADKTTEKAKIEIELPSITDAASLSKLRWKAVQKPADILVEQGVFSATPSTVELSLGSGASVEDEILFEVQVGLDGGTFTAASKMNVRVVRDRMNLWFEPFSMQKTWRTSKPEPREDTGDYILKEIATPSGVDYVPDTANPLHKSTTYKRESLQSLYEVFKSTTAYGSASPKVSWLKPTITCFGEFHEALKTANGNNPLVDLNSLASLKMADGVSGMATVEERYAALRYVQGRKTTYPIDDGNPNFMASQFPDRVQWASEVVATINSPNLTRGALLAIWQKEGSLTLNKKASNITNYPAFPSSIAGSGATPPSNFDEAKILYISDAAFWSLGADFLLLHDTSPAGDNAIVLSNYAASIAAFKAKADSIGGAGMGDQVFARLIVQGTAADGFTVSTNGLFYKDMLTLVGKFYLAGWQTEGPDITYMVYNLGASRFADLKATMNGNTYPERARLGLLDWAIHYEIRYYERWLPRANAQNFHAYRLFFEEKYP
jgi:hypothetical protein